MSHNPLVWWEKHYQAVGRKEGYTAEQIDEYRLHIAHARAWMEMYKVVDVVIDKAEGRVGKERNGEQAEERTMSGRIGMLVAWLY